METNQIRSKQQFFTLWEAGVLGNRTRLWRNPADAYWWAFYRHMEQLQKALLSIFQPPYRAETPQPIFIGFREIRPAGAGAGKWERVPYSKVFDTATQWKSEGRRFVMDDGAPDDKRTLQGEVCRTFRGLESYLEVGGNLPMRPAMAAGLMKHRGYAATRVLLDQYMDPSSRDDLDDLLELYPDATIEFSCFTVDVGVIPGRNTIFWETRNY